MSQLTGRQLKLKRQKLAAVCKELERAKIKATAEKRRCKISITKLLKRDDYKGLTKNDVSRYRKNPNRQWYSRGGGRKKLSSTQEGQLGQIIRNNWDQLNTPAAIIAEVKKTFNIEIGNDTARAYGFRFIPNAGYSKPIVVASQPTVVAEDVAVFFNSYAELCKRIPWFLHFNIDETALVGVPGLKQKVYRHLNTGLCILLVLRPTFFTTRLGDPTRFTSDLNIPST